MASIQNQNQDGQRFHLIVEDEVQKYTFIEKFTRAMERWNVSFKCIQERKSHSNSKRPVVKSYAPVYLKRNLRKIASCSDKYKTDEDDATNFNIIYDYKTMEEIEFGKGHLKRHKKQGPILLVYKVLSLQKGSMDIKQKRFNAQMAKRYFTVYLNLLCGLLKNDCSLQALNMKLYFALLEFNQRYPELTLADEKGDWGLKKLLFFIQNNTMKSPIVNPRPRVIELD